jgi:5-oxoprolinase (ATP-hydrolysing) subunit A
VLSDKPAAALRIDLNADLGERTAGSSAAIDRALMAQVTSASIACGQHAGDPIVMRECVALALEQGVAVGAHPSFPDPEGFGRRDMQLPLRSIETLVMDQVGALAAIAASEGVNLQHVKPHGALYNMAAHDAALADAIARATAAVDPSLILFGPPHSELIAAAHRAGLRAATEVFADRGYRADGSLMPRGEAGALIEDGDAVAAQALALAAGADTICLHGDTPGAVELARRVRATLEGAGIQVKSVGAP